ncbi:hypothetical protein PSTG_02387 [Puccinia striiformis f. sp. tritici PST-78]|uniref:Uncharacterized protein n=1 Tax=Puccinia striiformis f. sp. tritici PST-78 TaxID=1165861 RepID=A0A0L0VYW6_9BASI|nr:hypothetical protein PSTG_02387 [Puccinia striiformis f. sp. tritici PST-78]
MQKRFFMDHPTQISSNYEHRIGYLEEIVGLLLAKQGHHTVSCTVSTAQPTSSFRYSIDRGLIPLLSKTTKESLTYGRNAKSKETRSSHYSDRSFGIHHRPSIISVDSFNRSFSSLNCSTGSKPRLNSLLSGAINTQPPPPATPTSVNYSNLGSSATGPNHLLISTPDLMTCDSPPFFPASATLEPRPSLADRLSSKGKKKNPPFQLHSPDQLPFSSRPVSPRTKNILDGIGIENHNSRIDIENDLEITTGFGPCPAAETAPPPLRTSGLTFKPPHDQRSRSHTPPHQQRSQSSSCTQLDSRRRLSTSRPQRHSFTSSSTTSQACNLIIVRSHNPVFPLGSTSSALFTSSPSNLLIGPSSQKQTIHSSSQSHSSSECPSHSHSVFLKEHGDAKTLVGDHSDSGTKTKKLAVDPQSPRPIIVTNPRPDLNKLIKPLSSLHPTNQITPTPPSASPSDLPADSNTITPISAPSCMTTAPRTTKKTDRHSQVDTGFSKSDTTPLFFIDASGNTTSNLNSNHPEDFQISAMGSISIISPTEAPVSQLSPTEYERLLNEAELADYLEYLQDNGHLQNHAG